MVFPKDLKQTQPNLNALARLPNDKAKQEVLDVVGAALKKGNIKTPTAYLRKVVSNYLDGDFSMAEEINATKGDSCPYCDKRGDKRILKMTRPNKLGIGYIDYDELCSHNEEEIKAKLEKGHKLRSGIGRNDRKKLTSNDAIINEKDVVPPPSDFRGFGNILKTM